MEAALLPTTGRPTAQAMAALRKANRTRIERAELKRKMKRGELAPSAMLSEPVCASMTVWDWLVAIPRYGSARATRLLRQVNVSPSRVIGALTERETRELSRAVH